jgi:CubicO group peptidase (beta-lactamase class C family)
MTDVATLIAEAVRRRGLGGVGVAVVRIGREPTFTCAGLADAISQRPISPDTVFRVASISKTMTAIGLMRLRDEGRFALDDPVNLYLKDLVVEPPPGGTEVTFRHLLSHTGGIGEAPRVVDLFRRRVWGAGRPGADAADVAALYGGTFRAEVPAGSKWAYANHGFVLLGQLVEDIGGVPLSRCMHDCLFTPLGMTHSGYQRTERTNAHLATGYHWLFKRFRAVPDYDLTILGAGAVLSSLSDMASYAGWLLGGGGDVIGPATLEEMTTTQHTIDPRFPGIGLAFSLSTCGSHRVFGHDGNMPGFASALVVAPDDGVAVVVLTNTATVLGATQLAGAVLRSLLGVPDPVAGLPVPGLVEQPHLWPELQGHFGPAPGFLTNLRGWQILGGEIDVVVRERRLVVRAFSPVSDLRRGFTLHVTDAADPLRFAFIYDGQVVHLAFARNAGGTVDRVIMGRPVSAVLHRRRPARSSGVRVRVAAAVGGAALMGRAWTRRRR